MMPNDVPRFRRRAGTSIARSDAAERGWQVCQWDPRSGFTTKLTREVQCLTEKKSE